jgi:hypothetical protein
VQLRVQFIEQRSVKAEDAKAPRILAAACDALSPQMLCVIEDLAGGWRARSGRRGKIRLRAADDHVLHWADHRKTAAKHADKEADCKRVAIMF